ncbi:MAG: glycosyl hydrolase 115 family protein [Treponema sp.]|nr:glycosyl hydrolase 115 family protein [Treponema sp.]
MSKFIFTVETEAFEGVKRTARKVAADFEKVSGTLPCIGEKLPADTNSGDSIIFATLGKSPLVDMFIKEGKFDPSAIRGKREVYQIKFINVSGNNLKTLLICGSDKRGTIYGMFALSEYIGVSPLHFWGDVEPDKNENIEITDKIETISKEPSVKYRGLFINDEWPCFGSWTFLHFGGFTAEMYDHVFELLLRLKGNYLWPAMWSSSFALDGPGKRSEELADIYGIVVGASHHEPCLRASEEWDRVRGVKSVYGNDWNYEKNKNGLLKYWEDGLRRSGKYEKIIIIGMRGERDSSMLDYNSSLKENIDILKDIIKNQRDLIRKNVNPDIDSVPQMLAFYKEVEEYYYGNEQVEGLKDWDELNGVIYMLCEDNFGFVRTLPVKEIRERKGGFGMYYHLDYHGGPVSYEWMPSTSFERIWDQMSMAYDYGAREVWVINVGDLKFNEVPFAYFMELAYDFEKWGTNSANSIDEYTEMWLKKTFPSVDEAVRKKMSLVLHGYIRMNAMRRPETQNAGTYHPCNYLETDRMLSLADSIDALNEEVHSELSKNTENVKTAYYILIYYPAKASVNLLRMNLLAGKNRHYAYQGKKAANDYAALVTECIEKDRALSEELALFRNGKWKGMELEQHIGFVKWNEDNCRYPLRIQVEPAYKPRMILSRKDNERIYAKNYGNPEKIKVDDFLYAGNDIVIIEIANDGIGSIDYVIQTDKECEWLEIDIASNNGKGVLKGTVESQDDIILRCNRQKLACKSPSGEIQTTQIFVKDNETTVAIEVKAKTINTENLLPMTFLNNKGVITMEANHFCNKKDAGGSGFIELKNYGRSGCGMKVFPTTVNFSDDEEKPVLTYRFLIEETGEHIVEVWTTPVNSVQQNSPLRFLLYSSQDKQIITSVSSDFKAGSPQDREWSKGVLDNIRVNKTSFTFEKGIREISVGALEAGLVLERILIYKKGIEPLMSYLGPPESFFVKP